MKTQEQQIFKVGDRVKYSDEEVTRLRRCGVDISNYEGEFIVTSIVRKNLTGDKIYPVSKEIKNSRIAIKLKRDINDVKSVHARVGLDVSQNILKLI